MSFAFEKLSDELICVREDVGSIPDHHVFGEHPLVGGAVRKLKLALPVEKAELEPSFVNQVLKCNEVAVRARVGSGVVGIIVLDEVVLGLSYFFVHCLSELAPVWIPLP